MKTNPVAPKKVPALHILRAGTFADGSGTKHTFSAADIAAIASGYDGEKYPAPIVVGHPGTDAPAYGWIASLGADDHGLHATPKDVAPAFAEAVKSGAYRRISVSLFLPAAPANPKPGQHYLRHVGFLGGAAPAVPGLTPVASLAASGEGVIEFSDAEFGSYEDELVARLFRNLRDWVMSRWNKEQADAALNPEIVAALERYAAQPEPEPQPAASLAAPPENAVTQEEKAKIEAENAAMKQRIAEMQSAQAAAAAKAAAASNAQFCEQLCKAGRLLPAERAPVEALLNRLSGLADPVEFAEGEAKKSVAPAEILRTALSAAAPRVPLGEAATAQSRSPVAQFSAPDGAEVDAARLAHLQRAKTWQAQHPTADFTAALHATEE